MLEKICFYCGKPLGDLCYYGEITSGESCILGIGYFCNIYCYQYCIVEISM